MYKRFNGTVEIISISLLVLQLYFALTSNSALNLVPFFISCFIYLVLTLVLYYSLSPKVVFKTNSDLSCFGTKSNLTDSDKDLFISKAVFYSALFKLFLLLIPGQILLINIISLNSVLLNTISTFAIIFLAFYELLLMNYNLIKANGYMDATMKDTLSKGVFYNNPNDKRTVIDKPVGIGSTINLATKDGKIILWVLLAIPITIITLLVVVFSLTDKL